MNPLLRTKSRQSGSSLIEALVAIIVFALGMLGLAAFMVTAMQNSQQSRYRTLASYYAEEVIGLALSDASNREKYAVADGACTDGSWEPCTQWLERLTADLPTDDSTPASVELDDDSGLMTVTVQWKAKDSDEIQRYVSITDLDLIVPNP
jgi:type IV pilus assembly protein PilV